ncbi:Glycosyltransferase involved in cell wall bisynthesis [Abditibacterium utsteinense]|uniref:Glycosyltransferase involved in cell wall bisynthesis n=1 Tax=Abditibacterium utsteinense TaxID=1960156 RepID=A0A2S8SWM8_9BACT|nr:glycosyltransferase family 4 protein [Abditibacterium utsteinense]PQV65202.1 Glycosyltransferase involved in cell wall bisynthesis [Abditibacterium utsteinense]
MKIALTHVDLPNQSKGGVAHVAHNLGNALIKRGHEVTMWSYSPAFEECLYRVRQLSQGRRALKWQSFSFAFELSKVDFSGFDVVHTHGDNYWLRGVPQVRTFHGAARDELRSARSLPRKIKQLLLIGLEKRGAQNAALCTGVSRATQQRIPAISRVISNGVDLMHFTRGKKSPQPTILFVGTSGGRKRGRFLAEIFARAIKPQFPDAELWSVAEAPLAVTGEGIKPDGIIDFGRVSDAELARLYREAWVFCLPSTYEGFGVPYIEAMAAGTAVIASPNAGALEVLDAEKWGIIAQDDDLESALKHLLCNAADRESLSNRGLERARDYSWENVVSQYEMAYRDAIEIHKAKNQS